MKSSEPPHVDGAKRDARRTPISLLNNVFKLLSGLKS